MGLRVVDQDEVDVAGTVHVQPFLAGDHVDVAGSVGPKREVDVGLVVLLRDVPTLDIVLQVKDLIGLSEDATIDRPPLRVVVADEQRQQAVRMIGVTPVIEPAVHLVDAWALRDDRVPVFPGESVCAGGLVVVHLETSDEMLAADAGVRPDEHGESQPGHDGHEKRGHQSQLAIHVDSFGALPPEYTGLAGGSPSTT